MAEAREVRVKLTADASEYVTAMRRARRATQPATTFGIPALITAYSTGALIGIAGCWIATLL